MAIGLAVLRDRCIRVEAATAKMSAAPLKTGVSAGNRYEGPAVGSARPEFDVSIRPTTPASSADAMKDQKIDRLTRTPTRWAARSFEPMLSRLRPAGVW